MTTRDHPRSKPHGSGPTCEILKIIESPLLQTIMWVCKLVIFGELESNFIEKILFEFYGTFQPINPNNSLQVGLPFENLYQNVFFRFGFVASRSILSRFFCLNGFTLVISLNPAAVVPSQIGKLTLRHILLTIRTASTGNDSNDFKSS